MKSNTAQLNIAKKYLGESCPKCCHMGSNCCCYFVSKIFAEAGNKNLFYDGKTVTYCPNAIKWCKAHLAEIPPYLALPSDIIFFDWELNGTPNHIGFVASRVSATEINTLEGNTSGGIVAYRTRASKYIQGIYRPHFKPTGYSTTKALEVDGLFGYNSIAMLQKALGIKADAILGRDTVKALQKKAGVSADGRWGNATSKAVQKMVGAKADGLFGAESVKALQRWINKQTGKTTSSGKTPSSSVSNTAPKPSAKKTKADEISDKAVELSWAYGTASSKYAYKGGSACPKFKAAWQKYFPKQTNKAGCHQFVMLVLKALGYPTMPSTWSGIIAYLEKHFTEVKFSGKESELRAGDIWVRKDKKKDGTSYHIMIIVKVNGKLMIAEAQQSKTYSHINSKIGKATQKHDKVWLFRAK